MSNSPQMKWEQEILLDDLLNQKQMTLGRGNVISKIDIRNNSGPYPIYSSSAKKNGKMGEYGSYMFDEELISWSVDGGGNFFYRPKHKFSVTNVSGYLRIENEKWNYRFLHYSLDYQHGHKSFDYQSKAHPSVIRDLYSFPTIPVPEQQKIASILTSVDDVIEKMESQISKLQDLKKSMMQELLTKGIAHATFKDSPIGRIPMEWKTDNLINLSVNGINNGLFNDPKKVGKGYKLINVVEMYRGFGVDINTLKLLDVDEREFLKNKVEYGDVFFTRSSLKLEGIAYCNVNLSNDDDITYDGHLMRVRPDQNRVLPKYLAYYCLSDQARSYFMRSAKHSTMTTIGQADIAPLNIALPSIDEQQNIVMRIESVENRIKSTRKKLSKQQLIKKALMQDLLTGKIRVILDNRN